jgi:SAM-dependent methyltransferase
MAAPIPPAPLRTRVSLRPDPESFESRGAASRSRILELLPADFEWSGARALDFGCGVGRTLRHFTPEAERCEDFLGCDIDPASIEWVKEHLEPPFNAFVNDSEPPLPIEAASLDMVFAVSVFTHLADSWARWLAELHRVLRPGGLLITTFQGRGMWPNSFAASIGTAYEEIGMHVEQPWGDFHGSFGHGPAVFHSPWWLREHWGRGFELDELHESGFLTVLEPHEGQGYALWRRSDGELPPAELERLGNDPRELSSVELSATLSRRECAHHVAGHRDRVAALGAEAEALREELDTIRSSKVMRLSEPIRRLWYRVGRS